MGAGRSADPGVDSDESVVLSRDFLTDDEMLRCKVAFQMHLKPGEDQRILTTDVRASRTLTLPTR